MPKHRWNEEWQFAFRERWFHAKASGPPGRIQLTTMDDRGRVVKAEAELLGRDLPIATYELARAIGSRLDDETR